MEMEKQRQIVGETEKIKRRQGEKLIILKVAYSLITF